MPSTAPRSEHVAWCKTRALQYVDAGDLGGAFASLTMDLRLHPETENHAATELGMMLMMGGYLNTPHAMREWINGVQ